MENQKEPQAKEGNAKRFNKVLISNEAVIRMQFELQKKLKFRTDMMLARLDFLIEIARDM